MRPSFRASWENRASSTQSGRPAFSKTGICLKLTRLTGSERNLAVENRLLIFGRDEMHEWIVMHEEGNCALFPFYFFVEPWGKRLKPILGENLDMLVVIREGKMRECVVQEQYERAGRKVFESLPSAFPHYMERTDSWLGRVEELCGKLEARKGWNEASNAELNAEFAAYCETIQNLNTWGMMVTLMEYAKSSFVSDKLYSLVSKHLSSAGSKALPTQVISTLTTPFEPTFLRLERKQAALLALEKKRGKGVSAGIDALWKIYSGLSP